MVVLVLVGRMANASNPSYSLDGIALGSSVKDAVRVLGEPDASNGSTYKWNNSSGGTVTVVADSTGSINLIDVLGGSHEQRDIDAAGGGGTLGETGHVNFVQPPNATVNDRCGAGLSGSPCIAYTLPGDVELVANFGKDTGLADWALSELILANRALLLKSGKVIGQP